MASLRRLRRERAVKMKTRRGIRFFAGFIFLLLAPSQYLWVIGEGEDEE